MNSLRAATAYSKGAGAYARVGVETGVMAASPHQLILMLFDGAGVAIRTAKLHLEKGNMAEKGQAISKALDIVNDGLLAVLDPEQGELSASLASLYVYISRQLMSANLHNDMNKLDEAAALLEDIASAWRSLGNQNQSP